MKASRLAFGLALASVTLVTSATASEQAASAVVQPAKAEQGADCSKETWPNFSTPCLRNANPTVEVRLETGARH